MLCWWGLFPWDHETEEASLNSLPSAHGLSSVFVSRLDGKVAIYMLLQDKQGYAFSFKTYRQDSSNV